MQEQQIARLQRSLETPSDAAASSAAAQLAALQEQLHRFTADHLADQRELARKDEAIADLQRQVELLHRQLREQAGALGAIAQKDAQITALQQETTELWQQLQDSADQSGAIAQKDAQIASLRRETEELWQQLAEESEHPSAAALAEKDRQLAELGAQLARLEAEGRSRPDLAPSLAAKDHQIAALSQQLDSLHPALETAHHTIQAQAQRLATLEATLEQQVQAQADWERAIAQKEAQLASLQQQLATLQQRLAPLPPAAESRPVAPSPVTPSPVPPLPISPAATAPRPTEGASTPPLDPAEVERQLKNHLGGTVWFCLDAQSQNHLCHAALMQHQPRWLPAGDYSEVGDRLCRVIAHEIVQPFFQALYDYLSHQNRPTDMGGISLQPGKTYPFGLLPSLLMPQWETLQDAALQLPTLPDDEQLYEMGTPAQLVGTSDRALIQHFLGTWEHPLAAWLLHEADRAAAWIDQIHKLHLRIQQERTPLYEWQFALLSQLVIGDDEVWGMLQAVYRGRR